MKWLWGRILRRRSRSKKTADEQLNAESKTSDCPRPRLAFLVRDAAGPASYRLHTFDDAASAAAFVQFWFPPGLERGTLAFWAAHQEPVRKADSDHERPVEVVVLIRDEDRPGVVYPFSFSDLDVAHAWLAREAARGLGLRSALVYWALPVRITRDHWGRVRLAPDEPPALRHPERAAAPPPAESTRSAVPPLDETVSEVSAVRQNREDRALEVPTETDDVEDAAPAPAGRAAEPRAFKARNVEIAEEIADILREVDRIVRRNKRWQQREGPFQGFDSPPGKF